MNNNTIDGFEIYDYIISGAKKIINHEKTLNLINVFPIADGDTGSNLSFTMKSIIAKAPRHGSVSDTLEGISNIALEDSFGNSGTIFASFFSGLAKGTKNKEQITIKEFSEISCGATTHAYSSISEPVEGTVLTIMKAWSEYMVSNYMHFKNIHGLFENSLIHTKEKLDKTRYQLKELEEAEVVDAGALGFVLFIEGIIDFFKFGKVVSKSEDVTMTIKKVDHGSDLTYRYCTELFIESNNNGDLESVKSLLSTFSDSIVVQKNTGYIKLHCHTDYPDKVTKHALGLGTIIKSKVDDMKVQLDISSKPRGHIGIITDTIADIPKEWIEKYYITRIPLQMIVDGNAFVDRLSINSDNLADLIESSSEFPKSAQPSETSIKKSFEFLLEHYDYVIGLFVSSKMSGLFSKVTNVMLDMDRQRVFVIDTKTNSACQGLMVGSLIELIEKGYSAPNIVKILEERIPKYKIYVQIPDLNYAVNSGRVPKAVRTVAELFKLKVIISIDEEGKGIVTKELSLSKAIDKFISKRNIKSYSVVHSNNLKGANDLVNHMHKLLGQEPRFIEDVSTVVGAFVGVGSVGIGFEEV